MSCYDRIIIALASLINRKYGQHRSIVAVHAQTLKEARYKLRTALGISELEYSHCPTFPLYGSGQGAGNSPCIWLLISSTLFDIHNSNAFGTTFTTPDGTITSRLTMVGFVDDSTGSCNDFQPQGQCSLEVLAARMQQDAQLWNDLLFCSGGRLELGKCSFHVLHFEFQPDGTPRPMSSTMGQKIELRDSISGRMICIPAKNASEAHKTLGHYKAPADQPQCQQLAALQKRAKTRFHIWSAGGLGTCDVSCRHVKEKFALTIPLWYQMSELATPTLWIMLSVVSSSTMMIFAISTTVGSTYMSPPFRNYSMPPEHTYFPICLNVVCFHRLILLKSGLYKNGPAITRFGIGGKAMPSVVSRRRTMRPVS